MTIEASHGDRFLPWPLALLLIALFASLLFGALSLSWLCNGEHQADRRERNAGQHGERDNNVAIPSEVGSAAPLHQHGETDGHQAGQYSEMICQALNDTSATDRVMVIVTIAYVLVNYWMLLGIRRQADFARQSAAEAKRAGLRTERLEQPWLTPLPALPEPVSERDIGYRFRVKVVNYGRTPAWVTSRKIHLVRVVNREMPPAEPSGVLAAAISQGETVVAPKKKLVESEVDDLSDTDKADLMSGTLAFLLHGKIEYRDIFGAIHHTGFAWLYVRWHPRFKRAAPWNEWLWGYQRGPDEYWTSS